MQTDNHDLRVSARTCRLTAGANSTDDGPPYRFGGVAVAAGDVLHMDDGTRVLMTKEELQAAADTQAGEPLTKDHPEDDHGRPKYPPDVDETFGKVPKAGWVEEQEAVAYEASTHDKAVATGVRSNSYDVSVHPFFKTKPYDGNEADVVATDIRFGDLSVVSKGDSPSATAEYGPNQALASWTAEADIGEELTAASAARDDVDDDPEGLVERLARKMGIIPDRGDRRGRIHLTDQTSDGETITVNRAAFKDASWIPCAHLEGDEFEEIGPGLGPSIGEGMAMDAGETLREGEISLKDPLEEDVDIYVVLHFAGDDGPLEPITSAKGGYFYEKAFVGIAPEGTEVTADADSPDESTETTAAESAVESQETDMGDETSDGTDEGEQGDNPGGDGGSDEQTLAEMTPSEAAEALGDELKDQGFVTEDNADEVVAQATDEIKQSEKVDEIIAKSDDFDEDDREELAASPSKIIDREHKRVRKQSAAGFPGNTGRAGSLTASASRGGDTEDSGEYGTGVQGDDGGN